MRICSPAHHPCLRRPPSAVRPTAGVLPPPLTKPSSPLLQSDEYHIHCGRLAQLSLHSDVVLKALPPIVDKRVAGSNAWWEDTKELERVVKMYSESIVYVGVV